MTQSPRGRGRAQRQHHRLACGAAAGDECDRNNLDSEARMLIDTVFFNSTCKSSEQDEPLYANRFTTLRADMLSVCFDGEFNKVDGSTFEFHQQAYRPIRDLSILFAGKIE